MASDPFIQVGTPQNERGFNPLPDQSERSVFTRPPSGPTPADFLDKISYRGLDRLGAGLNDIQNQIVLPEVNRQAADEGAASVARDPTTGEITVVGGLHSNFLPWGRAYNDAAHKTFVLETDAQSKTAIQDIFQKNRDDPQKAKALADTYIKSLAAKAPPDFRADIALNGTQTAEQYLRGAVLDKSDRDTQRFIASSKAQIDDDTSTFVSLAGTPGGTSTPEFQQAHARVVKGWTDLAANPLTNVTPEVAEHQISLIEKRAKAEAILSNLHYGTEGLHVVQSALGAGQPQSDVVPPNFDTKNAPGMVQPGNLDPWHRKVLQNADGSYSTTSSMSIGTDAGEVLIPTVVEGKRLSKEEAIAHYNKTGENFGTFKTPEDADKYATALHNAQASMYDAHGKPLNKGAGGFDRAWQFTIQHEGGYAPRDANGQPVNFGINQGANPDVDVKSLTSDKAKSIAKERYWGKSGAADLPPGLDVMHFDTFYINPSAAKRILSESDKNPQRYMDLREQWMQEMISRNPDKFGRFATAWQRRNADLRALVDGQTGGSPAGKEEAIAELRSLHLEPDEAVTMINRAEGVVSDIQTEQRQALADAEHVRNLMSESTLKGVFEEAAHNTLTTQKVDALAPRLTADDYKTAMQMARGGGFTDNRNTVADLVVDLDSTDPSTYKSRVVSAMRSGDLTADTGRTMINQNRTAYSEGGPPTPYKQGRDYVKNALNPGELTKDIGGQVARSNALVEYDQWYAQHPEATADDANEQARKITQTYAVVEANQLPFTIGRPYGYTGQPTAASITVVELKRAQQRLETDYKAKRIGPDQLRSETRRLQAWKELLDRQKAKLP